MRQYLKTFLLILCSDFIIGENDPKAELKLPNSKRLKGVALSSYYGNKNYVEFRGLRYAEPPVEEQRFQPSKLFHDVWDALSEDATSYGDICPQLDPWYDPSEVENGSWDDMRVLGNEDCLFANVATSNLNPPALLPVLIWIHGGNYQSESGDEYGVGKLMEHDIVVVTFNYRLGPFGCLNSEDGLWNGNQGLIDQTLLLKWVKQTIHVFGGDPEKVTLAGSNTGGVSVHLHLLSNFSRGLFSRAIIQSGTAISPWVLMKEPKRTMKELAAHLKCGNDTDISLCILEKDTKTIVQTTSKMAQWFIDPMVPFGPSVTLFGNVEDRFLIRDPYSIISEGNYWGRNVPLIMGVNSHDGLLHAMDIGHTPMLRMVFNMEWYKAAPITLYYGHTAIDARSVSAKIWEFYFPEEEKEKGTHSKLVDKDFRFDNLTNLFSDRHFFVPLHNAVKIMGRYSKEIYLYWFDLVPEQSVHGLFGYNSSFIFGPSHYDQLQYIFDMKIFNKTSNPDQIEIEKRFVHGLYQFINGGFPPYDNWKAITHEMIESNEPLIYNRIGEMTEPISEPFAQRANFWNELLLMEYDKANYINKLVHEEEHISTVSKDEL